MFMWAFPDVSGREAARHHAAEAPARGLPPPRARMAGARWDTPAIPEGRRAGQRISD